MCSPAKTVKRVEQRTLNSYFHLHHHIGMESIFQLSLQEEFSAHSSPSFWDIRCNILLALWHQWYVMSVTCLWMVLFVRQLCVLLRIMKQVWIASIVTLERFKGSYKRQKCINVHNSKSREFEEQYENENHLSILKSLQNTFFWDRVSLWIPGCTETHSVDQAGQLMLFGLTLLPKCWD